MRKPPELLAFPPAYRADAERILTALVREYHLYMACMAKTAESMPNRQHYTTPVDILGLAVEELSKRLHKRAKHKREAKLAVRNLLGELGFDDNEGKEAISA